MGNEVDGCYMSSLGVATDVGTPMVDEVVNLGQVQSSSSDFTLDLAELISQWESDAQKPPKTSKKSKKGKSGGGGVRPYPLKRQNTAAGVHLKENDC